MKLDDYGRPVLPPTYFWFYRNPTRHGVTVQLRKRRFFGSRVLLSDYVPRRGDLLADDVRAKWADMYRIWFGGADMVWGDDDPDEARSLIERAKTNWARPDRVQAVIEKHGLDATKNNT